MDGELWEARLRTNSEYERWVAGGGGVFFCCPGECRVSLQLVCIHI